MCELTATSDLGAHSNISVSFSFSVYIKFTSLQGQSSARLYWQTFVINLQPKAQTKWNVANCVGIGMLNKENIPTTPKQHDLQVSARQKEHAHTQSHMSGLPFNHVFTHRSHSWFLRPNTNRGDIIGNDSGRGLCRSNDTSKHPQLRRRQRRKTQRKRGFWNRSLCSGVVQNHHIVTHLVPTVLPAEECLSVAHPGGQYVNMQPMSSVLPHFSKRI